MLKNRLLAIAQASKILNVKCDARMRKEKRHSDTSVIKVHFSQHGWWIMKSGLKSSLSSVTRAKWKDTSKHDLFWKKPTSALQPTSFMPLCFSTSTNHWKWPQKFAMSSVTHARAKWKVTSENGFYAIGFSRISLSRLPVIDKLFNASPQRVESNIKSLKLYFYDIFSVVVRVCTV